MKFIINKKDIDRKLTTLSRVIQRTHIPILDCILIEVNNDVKLTTSNNEMSVTTHINNANIESKGCVAVEAKSLSDAIRMLPSEDISFTETETSLNVAHSKGEFELPLYNPQDYPLIKGVDSDVNVVDSKLIRDAIPHMGDDELRPILNGVYLDFENGAVVASNCISMIVQSITPSSGSVLIPRSTAYFIKDMDNEVVVKFKDEMVNLVAGDYEVTSKTIEGRYPNYNRIIPKNHLRVTFNKEELIEAIKRASIFSNINKLIEFDINEHGTTLYVKNNNFGTSAKEVVSSSGDSININFQSELMHSVLNSCDNEEVVMEFSSPSAAMLIREGNKTLLLMPMMAH